MEFKTLGLDYNLDAKSIKSSCKLKHGDSGISAKLKHNHPSNTLGFELAGKNWEASYDMKSKDVEVKRTFKLEQGELKLKQKLPGSKLELFPSPEVQWKSKIVDNKKISWEIEPSYCFQARKGKFEQEIKFGSNTKLKTEMSTDKAVKPVATLSYKLKKKFAEELTLKGSNAQDVRLTIKSEPHKQVEVKTSIGRKLLEDVKVTAEVKGNKISGFKPKLTVDAKLSSKNSFKPTGVVMGLQLEH